MNLCVVDCSGTSVLSVAGRLGIPTVSRETEGRVVSPPRGVGVVLYGSPLPCRGQTDPRQEKAASWWNARPQGQADLSVSATNSGGKYTGELIPNPRERWFHVKPEECRWRVDFVEGLLADVVRTNVADEWSAMPSQPLPRGRHRFAFQQ